MSWVEATTVASNKTNEMAAFCISDENRKKYEAAAKITVTVGRINRQLGIALRIAL
jgi:hypothetical protein